MNFVFLSYLMFTVPHLNVRTSIVSVDNESAVQVIGVTDALLVEPGRNHLHHSVIVINVHVGVTVLGAGDRVVCEQKLPWS